MRKDGWSKVNQLRLEELAASGIPASQVAEALGTTRNAILGRAHRTGVTFHGKRYKPPRKERAARIPRAPGAPRGGRRKGQYIKPRALILQCLALHLAGVSQVKAAKTFGVSFRSIGLVWKKDPVLMAEAQSIADRALAEARGVARERSAALKARQAAYQAEAAAFNEMVFKTLSPRQVSFLRAYVKHRNMAAAAEQFGVTRERIRQVVVLAERKGFVPPTAKGFAHRRYAARNAA
jgi:hypothetical protein